MSNKIRCVYEFGPFYLNADEKLFLKNETLVPLTPKAFDTLLYLVQKNGQLVEKDELIRMLWPDSFVAENSLTQNIHQIRKALGEKSDGSAYIETVPRRGYRFKADMREIYDETAVIFQRAQARVLIEEEITESDINEKEVEISSSDFYDETGQKQLENKAQTKHFVRKHFVITVCAVLVLAAGIAVWQWKRKNAVTNYKAKSIAILPFKPLGQNQNDEKLGLGMADALIMKLSGQQKLQVKPTSAIIKYTGREHNAIEVGRDLEVDVVVDGTVQQDETRVRVNVNVLDVRSEKTLWTGKFDEAFTDIFNVQDTISTRVSESIALQLSANELQQFSKRHTNNTEAYQEYVMGIYFWNKRSKDSLEKAVGHLKRSIAKDPNYALAYAALADCYYLQLYYNYEKKTEEEACKLVEAEANKALSLDANLAEAHVVIAGTKISFKHDVTGAEESFKRALTLNPNYSTGHLRYAWLLFYTGRWQESLSGMKKAQELDPLSPTNNTALGSVLMMARQYDEALKYCRRAVELDPNLPGARITLADVLARKGLYDEAINELQKLLPKNEVRQPVIQGLAFTNALAGRQNEAEKYLAEIIKTHEEMKIPYYNIAIIYTALGDKDKAFEWLNKMPPNKRTYSMLKNDPDIDPLRNDPRFAELLKKNEGSAE